MTEGHVPANVTGVAAENSVNEHDLVNVNNIANGTPNVYNSLVQRVRNWLSPSQSVDDSTLLSANAPSSPVLLMATDVLGSPSIVGTVSIMILEIFQHLTL